MEMQFVFCEVGSGLVHMWRVKLKVTLEQATNAQRGCRDIAVLFL